MNTPRQTLFWLILALGPLPPARGGRAQSISLPAPAQASGLWEASDGEGGAVGIELLLTTLVNGRAVRLDDTKQQRQSLAAKVFHRTTPELKSGQANSFVDSPETPLDTDGQTLRLSWGNLKGVGPGVLLDLRYDKKADTWSGLFRRDAFSASVILMRPRADAGSTPNPLAGAWQSPDLAQPDCLHIAEHSDGTLTGWYDTLRVPGLLRYGNGIRAPDHVMESYGDALRATEVKKGTLLIELHTDAAGCCTATLVARLRRGNSLAVLGAQGSVSTAWRRAPGGTCLPPNP